MAFQKCKVEADPYIGKAEDAEAIIVSISASYAQR